MATRYALTVSLEAHEYGGEFYLVGEGYETVGDVLEYVATDHVMRITQRHYVEEYLLEVLNEGETVSEAEYDEWDSDVECGIHADISYQQFSF